MSRCRLAILTMLLLLSAPFVTPAGATDDEVIRAERACSYFAETLPLEIPAAVADDRVRRLVARIVDVSGLAQNFEIRSAFVPNAAAVTINAKRYVLYNKAFLSENAGIGGGDWSAHSMLAHEIGHHLNGHTLTSDGSRPQLELEADYFSGFVLQKLGAALVQSTALMERLAPVAGSATHPGKADRVKAISEGWMAACRKDSDCFAEQASAPLGDAGIKEDGEEQPTPPARLPSAARHQF